MEPRRTLYTHKQAKAICQLADHEILEWTRPKGGYFTPFDSGKGKGNPKRYSFEDLFYLKYIKLLKTAFITTGLISHYIKVLKLPWPKSVERSQESDFLSPNFLPVYLDDTKFMEAELQWLIVTHAHHRKAMLGSTLLCRLVEQKSDVKLKIMEGVTYKRGPFAGRARTYTCGRIIAAPDKPKSTRSRASSTDWISIGVDHEENEFEGKEDFFTELALNEYKFTQIFNLNAINEELQADIKAFGS